MSIPFNLGGPVRQLAPDRAERACNRGARAMFAAIRKHGRGSPQHIEAERKLKSLLSCLREDGRGCEFKQGDEA